MVKYLKNYKGLALNLILLIIFYFYSIKDILFKDIFDIL